MSGEASPKPRGRWAVYLLAVVAVVWIGNRASLPSDEEVSGVVDEVAASSRSDARTPWQRLARAANPFSPPPGRTPPPLHEAPPQEITILTLNLKSGGLHAPNIEARTEAVVDAIEQYRPDAIALQEVAESTDAYRNRGEVLAERTGYHFRWHRIDSMPYVYAEGVALLSRWPINSVVSKPLPHRDVGGTVERAVLGGYIAHPRAPFALYVTHLNVDASPAVQRDQAHTLWSFVRETRPSGPTFVAGDMNAMPDSAGMRFLRGETSVDGERGDFTDAWMATHHHAPGPTTPAAAPKRRIDYVFDASPPHLTTPTTCRRILTEPIDGVHPSDHFGVLCSFEFGAQ